MVKKPKEALLGENFQTKPNQTKPEQDCRKNFLDTNKLLTQTSVTNTVYWTKRQAFSNFVSCHQKSEY